MSEGFNAADRKDVRAAEKAARAAERERQDTVRNLCSTLNGRRYVWDKFSLAGIFVALPPTDALTMAFNEGIRAGGLSLVDDVITACPEQFIRMMQEANERNLTRGSPASEQSRSPNPDGGVEGSSDDYDDNPDGTGEDGRAEG